MRLKFFYGIFFTPSSFFGWRSNLDPNPRLAQEVPEGRGLRDPPGRSRRRPRGRLRRPETEVTTVFSPG